MQTRFQ